MVRKDNLLSDQLKVEDLNRLHGAILFKIGEKGQSSDNIFSLLLYTEPGIKVLSHLNHCIVCNAKDSLTNISFNLRLALTRFLANAVLNGIPQARYFTYSDTELNITMESMAGITGGLQVLTAVTLQNFYGLTGDLQDMYKVLEALGNRPNQSINQPAVTYVLISVQPLYRTSNGDPKETVNSILYNLGLLNSSLT